MINRTIMKRRLCLVLAAALAMAFAVSCGSASWNSSKSKAQKTQIVGFYNVENLFDTEHDEGKNDNDFLPDGFNKWTDEKYQKKLGNIAQVIASIKDETKAWHTVLGLAEVENRKVLEDLVKQPAIADAGFEIAHKEGPDRRGVDVAFLYRPDQFDLQETRSIPYTFEGSDIRFALNEEEQRNFRTRDVLMIRGTIGGEMFAFYVAHLPSRLGGKGADQRERGAEIIYNDAQSQMKNYPGIKIVVMGDMNDDPMDSSMTNYLHGKPSVEETGEEDFFNPFINILEDGIGSLYYRGDPCLFDIIMVNHTLVQGVTGEYSITPFKSDGYYGRVFERPFMTQQEGQYKGTPFRTFSHGEFIGGYSDHYPTYIVLTRK